MDILEKSSDLIDVDARKQVWAEKMQSATPMLSQYFEIKQQNPDSLLFFRMGDFYELFFDDAIEAAKALDITLTRRGKHQDEDGAQQHRQDLHCAGHGHEHCGGD